MAIVEALIDFGEDDGVGEEVFMDGQLHSPLTSLAAAMSLSDDRPQARSVVESLSREIEDHLDDARRGEILRSGLKIAIFGPPNAGKVRTGTAMRVSQSRLVAEELTSGAVLFAELPRTEGRSNSLGLTRNNQRRRVCLHRCQGRQGRPQ